jgi:hypothetical protein
MAIVAAKNITMGQIEAFESNLGDALKTIEETLAKKGHTHDELVDALRTVELAFSTGKQELLEYLELGQMALTRESIEQILTQPALKQAAEQNHEQVKNVLRGIARQDAEKLKTSLKKIKGKKAQLVKPEEEVSKESPADIAAEIQKDEFLRNIFIESDYASQRDFLQSQGFDISDKNQLRKLLKDFLSKTTGSGESDPNFKLTGKNALETPTLFKLGFRPEDLDWLKRDLKEFLPKLAKAGGEEPMQPPTTPEKSIGEKVEDKIKYLKNSKTNNPSLYKAEVTLIRTWANGGGLTGNDIKKYEGWKPEDFKTVMDALGEPLSTASTPPPAPKEKINPVAKMIADDLTDENIAKMDKSGLESALKRIEDFSKSGQSVNSVTMQLLKEKAGKIDDRLKGLPAASAKKTKEEEERLKIEAEKKRKEEEQRKKEEEEKKRKDEERKKGPEIKNVNQAYDAIDNKLDGNADRLAWTIRIIKRLQDVRKDMPTNFLYDRNDYFEIDNSLPAPEQEVISKKIMEAVYGARNPFLRTLLHSTIAYDNPPILKKILEFNGLPKTRAEAQKKIDDFYNQVKEIIKLGKDEFNKERTKKAEEKKRLEEEEKKKKDEEQRKKEEEEKNRLEEEEEKRLEEEEMLKEKPREIPSEVPAMLKEIAEELTKDKVDERLAFVIAWAIYKGRGSNILKKEDHETIVNTFKNLVQFSKTDNALMRDATRSDISDLLTKYKDILLAVPGVEKRSRHIESMRKTLTLLFLDNKDMEDKIQLCFQTLEIDPSTCTDNEERLSLEKVKKYILKVFNIKIPEVYGINNGDDYDKNFKDLREKDLDELGEKSTEVVKLIDSLEKEIKKYKTYSERKKKGGEKPPSGGDGGEIGDLLLESERKEADKEAKSEALDTAIPKLMSAVLSDSAFYHKKDPASLAIDAIIREKVGTEGLPELRGFLLKPKITISEGVSEMADTKSLTQLNVELKKCLTDRKEKEHEIKSAEISLGKIVNKEASDALRVDLKKYQGELIKLDNDKEKIEAAISYKNGTMRYYSTPQILAMINLYLAMKNNQNTTQKNIMKVVEAQIEAQREKVYSFAGKIVNAGFDVLSVGTLLKPTLKGTLMMLEKDEQLSKIGAEKLGKLAKAWDNRGAVDAWISGLEGSEEDRMTRMVPRIIAYLELALRDGNMRYLRVYSAGCTKQLVENLKNARHDYIMNKVEAQLQSGNASDVDKMNTYFRELNKATVSQGAITKKIVTRGSTYKTLGALAILGSVGTGVGFAGAAVASLGAAGVTAAGVGVLGGGAAVGAGVTAMKTKSPTLKKVAKSGALRTVGATALGVGALALGVGGIAAAVAALPGMLSPELVKKRKEIGKAGLFTVKKTAWLTKAVAVVGLTGGIALLSPRLRKLAFA